MCTTVVRRIAIGSAMNRTYNGGCHCGGLCFEVDLDLDSLIVAPVRYCDGVRNDWASTPEETRRL